MKDKKLLEIFGGLDRLNAIESHFKLLITNNIELCIMSFGYVNVIRKALKRMKLFDPYFKNSIIIGGDSDELEDVQGSKAQCIVQQFQKNNKKYKQKQIIFVDDDKYNINEAKGDKEENEEPVCFTVLIEPRRGMNNDHMQEIEKLAGIDRKQKDNKT